MNTSSLCHRGSYLRQAYPHLREPCSLGQARATALPLIFPQSSSLVHHKQKLPSAAAWLLPFTLLLQVVAEARGEKTAFLVPSSLSPSRATH